MKNLLNESLTVFTYEGANITFRTAEGVLMVNATEMASNFNKKPTHFLDNKEIKDYIEALKQVTNSQLDQIVISNHGGKNPGTWFCELLAIRFAQWLSPVFSVWVDVHVKELLTKGKTQLSPAPMPQIEKGDYVDMAFMKFEVRKYRKVIEAVPDRFIPIEYFSSKKHSR